jgi:hypothetical protein
VRDSAGALVLGGYRCAVTFPNYRTGRIFFHGIGVAVLFDDDGSVETFGPAFVRGHVVMLYDELKPLRA